MNLRPDEIAAILETEIERYEVSAEVEEVGTVIQIGDGIARIYGLDRCVAMERLEFDHGVVGLALNLEEDNVAAVLFGDWDMIKEGDTVRRSGKVMSIPVGDAMIGRVVDPLGQPIDGRGPLESTESRPMDIKAPGVVDRQPVKEPLQTGIKAIDSMIPIGRGQRELIIGDRKTGKTAICVDTILNQKGQDVICIYVAIGQKESTVRSVEEVLRRERRDGLHDRRVGLRHRGGAAQVHRPLRRLRHGRVLHVQRQPRAVHLRRSLQAGRRLSPDVAVGAPPAGSRGLSRRRLLPAFASAGTRRQALATSWAAARSRPCRSSRRRKATCRRTSRRT